MKQAKEDIKKVTVQLISADHAKLKMPLATALGYLRRRKKISASEFGRRAVVSRNYVGLIEKGEANPTLIALIKMVEATGATLEITIREGPDQPEASHADI